jgi:hypothetical protein
MKLRFSLLALTMLMALPAGQGVAKTLALVIGIDNYAHIRKLDGARNDARDITGALQAAGAAKVITLLDGDADRDHVVAAWRGLMASATAGDTIFLSYAGHGAQAPERVAGDEADGLDEFWVLAGFDPAHLDRTWRETVFDNELYAWFADADRRGVKIVFISDSCFAGGMERAVSGQTRFVEFRGQSWLSSFVSYLASPSAVSAEPPVTRLPSNVTLVAATSESMPVPEVVIDGHPRGALSWSVARALEGMADRNRDGIVTRTELEDYVYATVRIRSESLQTPVFTPIATTNGDERIFAVEKGNRVGSDLVADASGQSGQGAAIALARSLGFQPQLTLAVNGTASQPENTDPGDHGYAWDAVSGEFRSPNGEIAAERITPFTVGDVVSKFILLDFLSSLATRYPGAITLSPEKSLYRAGERMKIEARRGNYANQLVFNLANTGEVQYLDAVIKGEPAKRTPLREMRVVEPFGANHIVAISSNQPLDAINAEIGRAHV